MRYFYKIIHNGQPLMIKTSHPRKEFETEYCEENFIVESKRLQAKFEAQEAEYKEIQKPIQEQNERVNNFLREFALKGLKEYDLSG